MALKKIEILFAVIVDGFVGGFDDPRFRMINHADQGSQDFIVSQVEQSAMISLKISTLHCKFNPRLRFRRLASAKFAQTERDDLRI